MCSYDKQGKIMKEIKDNSQRSVIEQLKINNRKVKARKSKAATFSQRVINIRQLGKAQKTGEATPKDNNKSIISKDKLSRQKQKRVKQIPIYYPCDKNTSYLSSYMMLGLKLNLHVKNYSRLARKCIFCMMTATQLFRRIMLWQQSLTTMLK